MAVDALAPWFVRMLAFAFGAVWGSFFNVAIYRWPRGLSVVSPPSQCPHCGEPVRARHNVPILGWLWLRGKAACCGGPLSPRYPLVELLTALLAVAIAERWLVQADPGGSALNATLLTVTYFAFVGGLLIVSFVDLEWMEIPDEVSLPCAALGLATAAWRPDPGAAACALGAGAGFLTVQVVFVWSYERLAGRRGMGEGDSKLLLMIGAFLGWRGALFALVAGAFQGLVVALVLIALGKTTAPEPDRGQGPPEVEPEADPAGDPGEPEPAHLGQAKIPYGPFLSLGALEFLFFGQELVAWYLGLFR